MFNCIAVCHSFILSLSQGRNGIIGPKGEKGEEGVHGEKGIKGLVGIIGLAVSISIRDYYNGF